MTRRGGSKALNFASVLPSGSGFGGSYPSDNQTPQVERSFEALAAPSSVADTMEALFLTQLGVTTILGWTGYVSAYDAQLTARGTDRWTVQVTLSKPTVDLSDE